MAFRHTFADGGFVFTNSTEQLPSIFSTELPFVFPKIRAEQEHIVGDMDGKVDAGTEDENADDINSFTTTDDDDNNDDDDKENDDDDKENIEGSDSAADKQVYEDALVFQDFAMKQDILDEAWGKYETTRVTSMPPNANIIKVLAPQEILILDSYIPAYANGRDECSKLVHYIICRPCIHEADAGFFGTRYVLCTSLGMKQLERDFQTGKVVYLWFRWNIEKIDDDSQRRKMDCIRRTFVRFGQLVGIE